MKLNGLWDLVVEVGWVSPDTVKRPINLSQVDEIVYDDGYQEMLEVKNENFENVNNTSTS